MNKAIIVFSVASLLSSLSASAESILEMHQRLCEGGKETSCERAAIMQEADETAKRIESLGEIFATKIDRQSLENNNKPELATAYPIVMEDYFAAESQNGVEPAVPDVFLDLCAQHYHEHWVDRKLVWPTNDSGQPDWATIYYYIVDHYYGYCLRSVMSGPSSS